MTNWTGFAKTEDIMGTLNWNVEKYPAYALINGEYVKVPHRNFTARTDTYDVFEAVGAGYRILQNREGFDFLMELVQSGEIEIETTLEYHGGRQVGVVARVPDHVTVGDDDHFYKYLMWINNHDGKGSFQVFGTDVCATCGNAFQLMKRTAKDKFTIPHTRKMNYKLQKAREAIKLSFRQTDVLKQLADEMINTPIDKPYYNQFLRSVTGMDTIDKEKHPKAYARANGLRYALYDIHQKRDYIQNYKNTRWGLMQTITDYTSNVKKYRNPTTRFRDLTEGPELNRRALALLTN